MLPESVNMGEVALCFGLGLCCGVLLDRFESSLLSRGGEHAVAASIVPLVLFLGTLEMTQKYSTRR
jgi:hypothetical protein